VRFCFIAIQCLAVLLEHRLVLLYLMLAEVSETAASNPMVRPSPKWWSTTTDRSDFTVPSSIPSTHLGIWACGSTWRRHTGKHGSSAPHRRITQPTSWPHVGVAHLVVHGTTGSNGYETIPPFVRLESSGGVLSAVDMVVQRRDGPRRLRDHDVRLSMRVRAYVETTGRIEPVI